MDLQLHFGLVTHGRSTLLRLQHLKLLRLKHRVDRAGLLDPVFAILADLLNVDWWILNERVIEAVSVVLLCSLQGVDDGNRSPVAATLSILHNALLVPAVALA